MNDAPQGEFLTLENRNHSYIEHQKFLEMLTDKFAFFGYFSALASQRILNNAQYLGVRAICRFHS
jgi:hypothetical protein